MEIYVELPVTAVIARRGYLIDYQEDTPVMHPSDMEYYVISPKHGELPISRSCFSELYELACLLKQLET